MRLKMRIGKDTICMSYAHKVNLSHYRPEVPRVFQEVKVPILRDNGCKAVSLTHRPLFNPKK